MTAQRWWVRLFARWQMRIDSIKGQIQAVSLAVTAFSTFSLVLQNAGLSQFVLPLGIVLAICGPIYAYLFAEGGVWNQVARDRQDMSSNFASPNQRIGTELSALALAAAMKGRELSDEEREAALSELDGAFERNRDGYDLDD
jgi:hypothetical protein